jgi:hypothetical protein
VTSCAVYTMHVEMRSMNFLVEPQNQGRRVSWFGPQNRQLWFSDLLLKITVMVSCLGHQNHASLVCRWRHKTDAGRLTRDTRRDLAACLT